jgi:hypothetical protein
VHRVVVAVIGADEIDVHAAVYAVADPIVRAARSHGPLPALGTEQWEQAPVLARVAALLVLAEGHVVHDPERAVRQRLRAMSGDLSAGHDWRAASRRPSQAELARRRGDSR